MSELGRYQPLPDSAPARVLSFVRSNQREKVFAVFNFSAQPVPVSFEESLYHGVYVDYFSQQRTPLHADTVLEMAPWSYRVFVQ